MIRKLFIILVLVCLAAPAAAGEIEDIAMQYRKMQALRDYHEAKLEKIVVDMSVLQQRYEIVKKQMVEKKADEKNPAVNNPERTEH